MSAAPLTGFGEPLEVRLLLFQGPTLLEVSECQSHGHLQLVGLIGLDRGDCRAVTPIA